MFCIFVVGRWFWLGHIREPSGCWKTGELELLVHCVFYFSPDSIRAWHIWNWIIQASWRSHSNQPTTIHKHPEPSHCKFQSFQNPIKSNRKQNKNPHKWLFFPSWLVQLPLRPFHPLPRGFQRRMNAPLYRCSPAPASPLLSHTERGSRDLVRSGSLKGVEEWPAVFQPLRPENRYNLNINSINSSRSWIKKAIKHAHKGINYGSALPLSLTPPRPPPLFFSLLSTL